MIVQLLENHFLIRLLEFFDLEHRNKIANKNINLHKISLYSSRIIQCNNQNQNVVERILSKVRFFNQRQNIIALQINGSLLINKILDLAIDKELYGLILKFDDQYPINLGQQIQKLGNNLKKLELNSQKHVLDAQNIQEIFKFIDHQQKIQELTLKSIITSEGMQKLRHYILQLKNLIKIDLTLSLPNDNYELVIQNLSDALQNLVLKQIKLNISTYQINQQTALNLINSIIQPQLLKLALNFNNCQLNSEFIQIFSIKLKNLANLKKLKLILSDNQLQDLKILFDQNKFLNLSSLYLNFESLVITNESTIELCKFLIAQTNLKKLTLIVPDNEINDDTGTVLMQSIIILNLTILVLDLGYNSLGDKTIQEFSQILQKTQFQMINVNFDDNSISDIGAKFVVDALSQINHKINLTLGLKCNNISQQMKCKLKAYDKKIYV